MPKEKFYILTLPKKHLHYASDMLRYDDAYQIKTVGEDYRIEMLQFTPARWESFGVKPPPPLQCNISTTEYHSKFARASGFLAGIRFAQGVLAKDEFKGSALVQDF